MKERILVYCQTCGLELTKMGGYVASNGKIYCPDNLDGIFRDISCIEKSEIKREDIMEFSYKDSEEVQRLIESRELVHFGRLESSVFKK